MNTNSDATTVLPQDHTNAPELQPVPRFSRTEEVEFLIKNHDILKTISEKYNTPVEVPDAPTISSAHKFYQKLNTSERVEIDYGSYMEIDVQSDMRYITQYLMFTTAKEYPDLDVKGFPYTSLPSLVAYKLALITAHFLICDLNCKSTRSQFATPYANDPAHIELLKLLQNCPVPEDVRTLIEFLAPVMDNQRQNLKFIPTFAAFSFLHDFGMTVPIQAFLQIHNILATNRTNADPNLTMHKIYTSPVANVNGLTYTIANLFGGPFQNQQDSETHRNWFSLALETFINPVVTRTLVQRPTFAKSAVTLPSIEDPADVNGYDYILSFPDDNELLLEAFITDVSRFYTENQSSPVKLGTFLSLASGLTILTHSIEPYVLPTWHILPPVAVPDPEKVAPIPTPISDRTYVEAIHFCSPCPTFTNDLAYPEDTDTIELFLYRVNNVPFSEASNPIKYRVFDPKKHLQPNVLWFQPYDKSSQCIELALTLGFKIISEEIDGTAIPLPHIDDDLTTNNSCFTQGSVPITNVRPYFPSLSGDNTAPIYERRRHTTATQPAGFSIRDHSRNVLPIMADTGVKIPERLPAGVTTDKGYNDPTEASTIVAWKNSEQSKIARDRFYLWSSYRHVNYDSYTSQKKISFYFTLRALTGTCITVSRTPNPAKLIPS